MLISLDKKLLFIGVPKTGSRSVLTVLSAYGIPLTSIVPGKEGYHSTYTECCEICESEFFPETPNYPNFDRNVIEKVYLFWRDPVERFISAANMFRNIRKRQYLLSKRPEWFVGVDLSPYITPYGIRKIEEDVLVDIENAAKLITPEQILNDSEIMARDHFKPQSTWHQDVPNDKLVVLNFGDFEQNLRTAAAGFGVPSNVDVPKLNESNKITTSLSPALETTVREYYKQDYSLVNWT